MSADGMSVELVWEKRIDPSEYARRGRDEVMAAAKTLTKKAHRRAQYSMKNVSKISKTGKRHLYAGLPSRPGTPPHVQNHPAGGNPNMGGLRPLIRSAIIDQGGEIYCFVGYAKSLDDLGRKHEHGGTQRVRNTRRRKRVVGEIGEYILPPGVLGPPGKKYISEVDDQHHGRVRVLYRRSRTPKAAAQANLHNASLYGPLYSNARYPRRPVIEPLAGPLAAELTDESVKALYAALAAH